MSYGQTIANIRTQYSIPANVSDSEVMKFAADQNITIDFSAKPETAQPQVKQKSGSWMNTIMGMGSNNNASAGATQDVGSLLGGNHNDTSMYGLTLERTTTSAPQVQQQAIDTTTFAEWQRKEAKKAENTASVVSTSTEGQSMLRSSNLNGTRLNTTQSPQRQRLTSLISKGVGAGAASLPQVSQELLVGRLDQALSSISPDGEIKIKDAQISENGTCIAILDDGSTVEVSLRRGEEGFNSATSRSDIGYKIFKDGKVITVKADGTRTERQAVNGEEGFVKDGEDLNERLARFNFGKGEQASERYNALSLEKKKELAKAYVTKYLTGKSADVQIGDFKKLLRNTPPESEMGQMLVQLASELDNSVVKQAIDEVYGTRLSDDAVSAVTQEMTEGGIIEKFNDDQELQRGLIDSTGAHIVDEQNVLSFSETSRNVAPENQDYAVQVGYQNLKEKQDLMDIYTNDIMTNLDGYDESAQLDIAELALQYDISNHEDIVRMVREHGIEGAEQILQEAERQYQEQAAQAEARTEAERLAAENQKAAEEAAKAKEQQQAKNQKPEEVQTQPQTQQPQTQNTSSPFVTSNSNNNRTVSPASSGFSAVRSMVGSSSAAQIISSAEFKSLNAKDSVEILKKMSSADQKAAIRTIVERTEGIELQGYMFTEMKNPIIRYLVSNPSPKNNAKLQYIEKYLTAEDKKFMQEVKEECKKAGLVVEQNTVRKNPFSFEA